MPIKLQINIGFFEIKIFGEESIEFVKNRLASGGFLCLSSFELAVNNVFGCAEVKLMIGLLIANNSGRLDVTRVCFSTFSNCLMLSPFFFSS